LLATLADDLKFVLITSRATLHAAAKPADEKIIVSPTVQRKCDRCWHWRADVGGHA
jgi:isoleucyl-tRNA synthetase